MSAYNIRSAHAQGDGWPAPGGFDGSRGEGPGRRSPSLTEEDLPPALLTKRLGLTADQKAKIAHIHNGIQSRRDSLQKARQEVRKSQQSLQEARRDAAQQIDRVLTSGQRPKVNALVRDANLLRSVGLPYQTLDSVTLTDAERSALTKLAQTDRWGDRESREARYQKALAALTAAHRRRIEAYASAHPEPRPPFGEFGGPGGPPPPDGFPGYGIPDVP